MKLLDLVTILSVGLLIGVEFAVAVFVNPILNRLEPAAEAEATQLSARMLGRVMPFWYALSLGLLVAETVFRVHESGFVLLVTASALWAAVILLTVLLLVPINNRIARMQPDAYTKELQLQHRRWDWMHRGRVAILIAAMVLLLVALPI